MGLVGKVSDSLKAAGFAVDAFTETEGNPSTDTVEKAAAAYKASARTLSWPSGGGSPMDVAKAVGVVAKYGGRIEEYEGAHKVPGKIVPLIAIPTTAGTGSEVTAFSVITDHRRDYKLTVFSYELLPACAILDAELLTSAPGERRGGLRHRRLHPCGGGLCFPRGVAGSRTRWRKRRWSCSAATSAALSHAARTSRRPRICSSARCSPGSRSRSPVWAMVHAMSHPISAYFDVPHGVANAVLLPVIAEYNALADHGRYFKIFNYISPFKVDAGEFEPGLLRVRSASCAGRSASRTVSSRR